MDLAQRALALTKERFPDQVVGEGTHAGQPWIEVKRERIVDVLRTLRDEMQFEMLMDVTCVDWLNQGRPERFCMVYELYSLTHNDYFRVKAWVPEDDASIPTVSGLWKSGDWGEREVFDMYGLRFDGHPDLRRILLPDHYTGHPLRKDYPLKGRGERFDFPKITR